MKHAEFENMIHPLGLHSCIVKTL